MATVHLRNLRSGSVGQFDTLPLFDPSQGAYLRSCVVDDGVSSVGEMVFSIGPENPSRTRILQMSSIVEVREGDEVLFMGRICDKATDFQQVDTYTCEGALGWLSDAIVPPFSMDGTSTTGYTVKASDILRFIVNEVNNEKDRAGTYTVFGPWDDSYDPPRGGYPTRDYCGLTAPEFAVGNVTVGTESASMVGTVVGDFATYEYMTALEVLKSAVATFGGFFRARYASDRVYIDWLTEDTAPTNTQDIELGENMLDVQRELLGRDFCTAILPKGAPIADCSNWVKYVANAYQLRTKAVPKDSGFHGGWTYNLWHHGGRYEQLTGAEVIQRYTQEQRWSHNWFEDSKVGHIIEVDLPLTIASGHDYGLHPYFGSHVLNGHTYHVYGNYVYDKSLTERYGWIAKMVDFGDIDDPDQLEQLACAELEKRRVLRGTVSVEALDMSPIDGSGRFVHGMWVHVTDTVDGIDDDWFVSGIRYDVLNPSASTVSVSSSYEALTEADTGSSAARAGGKVEAYAIGQVCVTAWMSSIRDTVMDDPSERFVGTWKQIHSVKFRSIADKTLALDVAGDVPERGANVSVWTDKYGTGAADRNQRFDLFGVTDDDSVEATTEICEIKFWIRVA